MRLGDARAGRLAGSIAGFARALRRAGLPVDAARIATACEAAVHVGPQRRDDFGAALEAVLVHREADRAVFRELFDAWFRDPRLAHQLLAQLLPRTEGRAEAQRHRPRVRDALAAPRPAPGARPREEAVRLDAAMSASRREALRHADFNRLDAAEFALVEQLARRIPLPLPRYAARRMRPGGRGAQPDWPGTLRHGARWGGELVELRRLRRRREPWPLLVLVDVSGSMERYARLLLAFLHAATRGLRRRDVFAFGTQLTDLTPAFRLGDTDAMLAAAGAAIEDFAGGTWLGESLARLRERHARRLVGRRTLVLLVSDGLDTGDPLALDAELAWLGRRTRRLVWLNPLLRYAAYEPLAQGAAVLHRHAHRMLAVHDLQSLEQLAAALAAAIDD
jgi:uncharacterized protein